MELDKANGVAQHRSDRAKGTGILLGLTAKLL